MNITLEKTAVEAVRDALAALIENEKQAQEKRASETVADTSTADRELATKLANHMLAEGLITKESLDTTVDRLSNVQTALPYVRKAIDLYKTAQDQVQKVAADTSAPKTLGRRAEKQAAAVKTSAANLDEAGKRFERAIGL